MPGTILSTLHILIEFSQKLCEVGTIILYYCPHFTDEGIEVKQLTRCTIIRGRTGVYPELLLLC